MSKHTRHRVAIGWIACVLMAVAFAAPAVAANWSPTIGFETKLSSDRTVHSTHIMFPIQSDEDSILFGDIRSVTTQGYSWEGNFGVGYRWLTPDGEALLGTYAFYDRRHIRPTDSVWQQITLGVERMTQSTTMRFNVYLPRQERILVTSTIDDTILIRGNNIIYQEAAINVYETALRGFDIGFTHRLDGPLNLNFSGTAFHFYAPDVPNVTGARFRIESVFEDILNISGSSLSLGFEAQHDTLRGTQSFVSFGIRIPLGGGKSADGAAHSDVRDRMMDPIERDIDIVTTATTPLREVEDESTPINPETGEEMDHIWFIEEGASNDGTGTSDDPISVEGLLNSDKFGPNQIIVAQGDNPIDLGEHSLTLLPGQVLLSGGGSITLQSANGNSHNFTVGGNPTTLTTELDIPVVTVSGNNIIRNIRIRGGVYGIFGHDVFGRLEISQVDVADSMMSGIDLSASLEESIEVVIADSQIDAPFYGVYLSLSSIDQVTVDIVRNHISSGAFGATVSVLNGGDADVLLADNHIQVSEGEVAYVEGAMISTSTTGESTIIAHGNVIDVTNENEFGSGMGLLLDASGASANITVTDNEIHTHGPVDYGILADASGLLDGDSTAEVVVKENRVESDHSGIYVISVALNSANVDVHANWVRAGLNAINTHVTSFESAASAQVMGNDVGAGVEGLSVIVSGALSGSAQIAENQVLLTPSFNAEVPPAGIFASVEGLILAGILVTDNHVTVEIDEGFEGLADGFYLQTYGIRSLIHAARNMVQGDDRTLGMTALASGISLIDDDIGPLSLWDDAMSGVIVEDNQISAGAGGVNAQAGSGVEAFVIAEDNEVDTAGPNHFGAFSNGNASIEASGNDFTGLTTLFTVIALGDAEVDIRDNQFHGGTIALDTYLSVGGDTNLTINQNTITSLNAGVWLMAGSANDVTLEMKENSIVALGDFGASIEIAGGNTAIEFADNDIQSSNGTGLFLHGFGKRELLIGLAENNVLAGDAGMIVYADGQGTVGIEIVDNAIEADEIGLFVEASTYEEEEGDNNVDLGLGDAALPDPRSANVLIEGNSVTAFNGIEALVTSDGYAGLRIAQNLVTALGTGIFGASVSDSTSSVSITDNVVQNAAVGIMGGARSLGTAYLDVTGNNINATILGILGQVYGAEAAYVSVEENEVSAPVGILVESFPEVGQTATSGELTISITDNEVEATQLGIRSIAIGRGETNIDISGNLVEGPEVGILARAISLRSNATVNLLGNTVDSASLGVGALAAALRNATTTVAGNQVDSDCLGIIALSLSLLGNADTEASENSVTGCNALIAGAGSLFGNAGLTIRENTIGALDIGILGILAARGEGVAEISGNTVDAGLLGIGAIGLTKNVTALNISENIVDSDLVGIAALGLSQGTTAIFISENTVDSDLVGIGALGIAGEENWILISENTVDADQLGIAALGIGGKTSSTQIWGNSVNAGRLGIGALGLAREATSIQISQNIVDAEQLGIAAIGLAGGDTSIQVAENTVSAGQLGIGALGVAGKITSLQIRNNTVNAGRLGIGALGIAGEVTSMQISENTVNTDLVGIAALGVARKTSSLHIMGNTVNAGQLGIGALAVGGQDLAALQIADNTVTARYGILGRSFSLTGHANVLLLNNFVVYGELPWNIDAVSPLGDTSISEAGNEDFEAFG